MMSTLLERLRRSFSRMSNQSVSPSRDWLALLSLCFFVLIVSTVWNLWLFDQVGRGAVLGGETVSPPPVFSRTSLESVEKLFADREDEAAKYETGQYRFVDPSK